MSDNGPFVDLREAIVRLSEENEGRDSFRVEVACPECGSEDWTLFVETTLQYPPVFARGGYKDEVLVGYVIGQAERYLEDDLEYRMMCEEGHFVPLPGPPVPVRGVKRRTA